MANIKLSLPILIQPVNTDKSPSYQVRPLFFSRPLIASTRFESAIAQLKKEIRYLTKHFEIDRKNADHLLWYCFNPETTFKVEQFEFTFNRSYVKENFGYATFNIQQYTVVCLPAFDYLYILDPAVSSKSEIQATVRKTIIRQLKNQLEILGETMEVKSFTTDKKSFVSSLNVNINISYAPFSFDDNDQSWLFSKLNNFEDFNGAVEIEKVGYDLNSRYPTQLKTTQFRNQLIDQLYHINYSPENTPVVIVGPEGVGKATVIHEMVRRYLENNADKDDQSLQKVWHIDPTRIIAGMMYVGWWQKRAEAIIQHVRFRERLPGITKKNQPADTLLIDNIVSILRIGKSSQNNMTLNDLMRPYLEKRQIQLILLATPQQWKLFQDEDRRFADLFQVIRISEPEPDIVKKMVLAQRKYLEVTYGCEITIQALKQLFTIQRNYLNQKALPGSIMRLMNQLAVKYKFQSIDAYSVRSEFEDFSGLNEQIFDTSETFSVGEVEKHIGKQLVGQEQAAKTLTNVIHTIKSRLSPVGKPLGSFLFIGPTGVGKTHAAKVLCQYLMGDEKHLLRFDMNEYYDPYAVHRLIGDESNPEGQLTSRVRYQPFGIVLLDEIEKAHRKVHDLLLQVLDDGRLTDSIGRTVDFTNTIIIMTSNVGAEDVAVRVGFETAQDDTAGVYRSALNRTFRPEFLNRIEEVVIFNPLQLPHILNIARLQIKELLNRDGFVRRTTILSVSTEALEWVARRGFDSKMGGRALRRQIESDLTTLSAEQLIATESDGPILMDIELEDGRLIPNITSLTFCDTLPEGWLIQLPNQRQGKRFFNRLIQSIQRLEDQLVHWQDHRDETEQPELIIIGSDTGENVDWQFYDLKDRVASVKQKIKTLSLGFRDQHFRDGPAIPLRVKRGSVVQRSEWSTKAVRESKKDLVFQREAMQEINEGYEYGSATFDSLETEFVNNYLDVVFLNILGRNFLNDKYDKLIIDIRSYIEGTGETEIKYLLNIYAAFFASKDIEHLLDEEKLSLKVEGFGIYELLSGEMGIHLFYRPYENPLPINFSLRHQENNQRIKQRQDQNQVLRLYDIQATLTDIRSGFTNDAQIAPEELSLMLYAGLPERLRNI